MTVEPQYVEAQGFRLLAASCALSQDLAGSHKRKGEGAGDTLVASGAGRAEFDPGDDRTCA